VGGLIGWNYHGTVINCYAGSDVEGQCGVGGVIGKGYETITNCYSVGNVSSDANIVGGFAGYNKGTISSSFWDNQTCGASHGVGETGEGAVTGVTGKTTDQMQTVGTFTDGGWDFKGESVNGTEDIWTICEGETYPILVRQRFIGDFVGLDGVDMADFAVLASAWRSTNGQDNWCSVCDISEPNDAVIDEGDLSVFADNWLAHAR